MSNEGCSLHKMFDEIEKRGREGIRFVDDLAEKAKDVEVPEDIRFGSLLGLQFMMDARYPYLKRLEFGYTFLYNLYRAGYHHGQENPMSKIGKDE